MKDRVAAMLDDKVTDIFIELQNELNIKEGDCSPLDGYRLLVSETNLAEIIAGIILKQKRGTL